MRRALGQTGVRADGSEPRQITRHGAWQMIAEPDGQNIFFTTTKDRAKVSRAAASGEGDELTVPEFAAANFGSEWAAGERGIYFLARDSRSELKIKFYDFANKKISENSDYQPLETAVGNFTVSPDETIFLFVRRDRDASNIMLAELGE